MSETFTLSISSLSETGQLASMIASHAQKGDVICLKGTLGAGKTAFSQAFINAYFGKDMGVTSPTFTLVQLYSLEGKTPIWHCDFYRLKDESELFELGLDDAFEQGITLIEWPEIAQNDLPEARLELHIEHDNSVHEEASYARIFHITHQCDLGKKLEKDIAQWQQNGK